MTPIKNDDIVGLMCLTKLIYEYNEDFIINDAKTTGSFISYVNSNISPDSIELSRLTDERKNALCILCKRSPKGIVHLFFNDKESDLQGGITINESQKKICVIFRGSDSRTDWNYNTQTEKIRLTNGAEVHSGFCNQLYKNGMYSEIVSEVKDFLNDEKYKKFDVYVTGHSLGGALATLFGYLIAGEINNFVTVVSFASPRVGNYEWRRLFDERSNVCHYRITNERDMITALPIWNYCHVGTNIRMYDKNKKYIDEYPCFEYSILSCWSLKDHSYDLYFKRVLQHFA